MMAFEISAIGKICLEVVQSQLADYDFVVSRDTNPIVRIKALHPDVSDITIDDDGDELTVYFGGQTHLHFDAWMPEAGVTDTEIEQGNRDSVEHMFNTIVAEITESQK